MKLKAMMITIEVELTDKSKRQTGKVREIDFENDKVTFCDIDLFRKMPTINDLGKDYFGTKRLKAPEENELGAIIDEKTNEFTLGAIIFDMLSKVKNNDDRYKLGMFIPNSIDNFELSNEVYDVLSKATNYDRNKRYNTIKDFHDEFNRVIKINQ